MIAICRLTKGTPKQEHMPHLDTLPPSKNVTAARLESTSPSTDVFEGLHEAYTPVRAGYDLFWNNNLDLNAEDILEGGIKK